MAYNDFLEVVKRLFYFMPHRIDLCDLALFHGKLGELKRADVVGRDIFR